MVALGEELGTDMAIRSLEHLLQYGEPAVRRTVPLALALLSASSPGCVLCPPASGLGVREPAHPLARAVLS